jgi:hypothetical protein
MINVTAQVHNTGFPTRVLSGMGGGHIFDVILAADHDNGDLVNLGTYETLGTYNEASTAVTFAGVIREQAANGNWYIEATADSDAVFIYMPEISKYDIQKFRAKNLFYNEEDSVVKGYTIHKGDMFELSAGHFDGTPTVGKTLTYVDGKYVVAA